MAPNQNKFLQILLFRFPKPQAGGSNPLGRTKINKGFQDFRPESLYNFTPTLHQLTLLWLKKLDLKIEIE